VGFSTVNPPACCSAALHIPRNLLRRTPVPTRGQPLLKEIFVKKTLSITLAFAFCATLGMAQDKPAAAPQPAAAAQATADPIIIAAGDVTIRQSEFESALKTLPAEYQQYAMGTGKKQFAEDFLRMKLLAREGMKAGLDKDPEVTRQLALMRENLVANAQLQSIEKSITISDQDLMKVYDSKKNDYEQVTAKHILIAFKGSPAAQAGKPELTEEQAKAKAADLRKQILAGASFEELAKKESDDTGSGANGGELGEFNHGQMVPEFEQAAFAAKVGEVTEPVRTQYGYHIIKVEKHGLTPFEQVKALLERNERQAKLQAQLEAMKTNAKATFNDAYFPPPPPPAPAATTDATTPAKKDETKKQ
jgi:peptidyl-prolyl cis-trans isomerase C